MLSPETFAALGRAAGVLGNGLPAAMLAAVLLHRATLRSYSETQRGLPADMAEALLLRQTFGSISCIAVFLCSRLVLAIVLPTAILATAGFVFNEVFVYWFPNFAFAAMLLAGVLAVNLVSESLAEKLQIVLATTALLAATALSVIGLSQGSWAKAGMPPPADLVGIRSTLIPVMVLIGFDLARFGPKNEKYPPPSSDHDTMKIALMGTAMILGLWAWVSTTAVPGERLAQSTIPHMIAARAIAGDQGRILMGVAVLSGTASALNALFIAIPRNAVGILSAVFRRPTVHRMPWWRRSFALILGLCIAAMLISGMAGEPVLDVWVRGGMLFWLLGYLFMNVSALRSSLGKRPSPPVPSPTGRTWVSAMALAILSTILIMLIISDPDCGALLLFMVSTAGVCWLGSWTSLRIWMRLSTNQDL
jgi:hypothetical protein